MKKVSLYFFSLFFLCFQTEVYPHGDGGEMGGNVGSNKGIQAVSHEEGMTVAPQAIKRLGLDNITLGNPPWIISKEGLIFSKDDKFVYLFKNGKYKSIKVDAIQKSSEKYQINSLQLKSNDQILIKGTALLRIAELDAASEEQEEGEDEHGKHEDHGNHDHEEEVHHD